jgi:hypothetical protein
MRCVGSSPAAAANALRNRRSGISDAEAIEPVVFDETDGLIDDSDIEPGTPDADHEEMRALDALVAVADALDAKRDRDPKVNHVKAILKQMLPDGAKPVIFCRFIATAEALGDELRKSFPLYRVEVVTGVLPPEERRARVDAMEEHEKRILVATDCLSEGINLQGLFNSVIHYDLSWNPTRHQQREGRVDRYGQRAKDVMSITIYGENSAIDGAVLQVIKKKADAIQKATGIAVPMPEDSDGLTAALMQALLLRSKTPRAQLVLDFGAPANRFEAKWRDAEEKAKASRARYAHGALRPDEVIPEWSKMRALNGGPQEVARFADRALKRIGSPLDRTGKVPLVHFHKLPDRLRERLELRGIHGSRRVTFADDPAPETMFVGRAHPLVAALAEGMTEGALDPRSASFTPLGRSGAWRTNAVAEMTTVLVLRLRFKLVTSGKTNRLLLAEEATGVAFSGTDREVSLNGTQALALLEHEASGNLDETAIKRQVGRALERYAAYEPAIGTYARERAAVLSDDHLRLTEAARGGATVEVEAVMPADVIGIYVLLPEGA